VPDKNGVMAPLALPSTPTAVGEQTMDTTDPPTGDGPIGTPEEFREVFARTYPSIVAYARRRMPADQVDDVVSEVFTVAWRRRADLAPGAAALPWLYGVASNVIRNLRRADQRHLRLVERIEAEPAPGAVPPPGAAVEGPGADLRAALARLSDQDQEVLRLVAWEGLSHGEAGQVLQCSANAVGIRIHRARRKLEIELARLADPTGPTSDPWTEPPRPDAHPEETD
jgi:RNA polymerase sigma factor (sigma-70 family)